MRLRNIEEVNGIPSQPALPGSELDVDELYILSGLLLEPDEETAFVIAELGRSWAWLGAAVAACARVPLEAWREEYQRLFGDGGEGGECPARESAWLPDCNPLDLAALYRRAAIKTHGKPSDFLANQLAFAAWHLEQESSVDPAVWTVLWQRLSSWVPRFGRELRERAELEIYRALGSRLEILFGPSVSAAAIA